MSYSNYHTHTTFCDGSNTPEQIVRRAIELGMDEIGFSAHSDLCNDLVGYRRAVRELQERYSDKISVRLGIEYDYFFDVDISDYDYVIGGVHYLPVKGEVCPIDMSEDTFFKTLNDYYGSDIYSLCDHYFEIVSGVCEKTKCDIVAHFDLVTKYNGTGKFFDTKNPRYLKSAFAALDELLKKPVIFEINTGAIARGYKTEPYPALPFIEKIRECGSDIILSSDCHNMDRLTESFDKYKHLATLDKLDFKRK